MVKILSVSFSLLAASLLLIVCSGLRQISQAIQYPAIGNAGTSEALLQQGTDPANGEQIYFTATDKFGDHTQYTGGPDYGGMMMRTYLTCAACHGPDAHGGQHVMHMQTMYAPPIYYAALTSMIVEESGGTREPGGYTLEDFRKAVIDGKHPDGDPLDRDMPRWQMSDQDLADLFAFLETIQR
jgi:mono/diheme cytochrome c family protein